MRGSTGVVGGKLKTGRSLGEMLSLVVFVFGLVICGIVGLGLVNAEEYSQRSEARQKAVYRQQDKWQVVSNSIAKKWGSRDRAA